MQDRELLPKKVRIAIISVLVLLAVVHIGIPQAQKLLLRHELIEQNIYEICTDVRTNDIDGKQEVRSVYMICRPAETEEKLQAMIDAFLEENEIVEKARQELHAASPEPTDDFRIIIWFIHPTRIWPVGRFLYENESFSLYTGMCIASVRIDNLNPEDIWYDFLLENLDEW